MVFNTNQEKGRAGMALGIAYFGANGYTVNIPLNDTQWYDFVVEKDNVFYTVQCKATGSKDNNISIKSKIIKIDTCNLEYASNFKIINEKWEHTCLDGTPDLRFKNNTKKIFIEVATLELKIFTQTITFLLNAEDNVFSFISTLKH